MVLEYKICSLPYFLDDMQPYELNTLLDILEFSQKQSWEQTRMIAYVVAQSQSTKHLKLSDIMSFSWEEEKSETLTKEDVDRLTKKMNDIINKNKLL